jgi:LuxR family transcriptional regulator, maltose regulon positive regulatory protein
VGGFVALDPVAGRGTSATPVFATAKFRSPSLPYTLVVRAGLCDRLTAGAASRLTVVIGSAGAGKSVLLSSWASVRSPELTAWLSCDDADTNPVRFWAGFAEALRTIDPAFGVDTAQLLAMDEAVSADVIASMANDAAKLPDGSAVIVDDFHKAAPAVSADMADLIERWPPGVVQIVLATRSDPPLALHRLRMSEELCELRDDDLRFSLDQSRLLLANFGVGVEPADLARLHDTSEGWAAALQMAALSIRRANDPGQLARALDLHSYEIPDYFISEVLDRQPADVAQFMLDTSVLCDLTAPACTAVTGRQDSAAALRMLYAAGLFLIPLDHERTSFRYHHLVKDVLRAELRARDRARERELQLRAAEWFDSAGDIRRSVRQYIAAGQGERALSRLQDGGIGEFLRDPADLPPPDLSAIAPELLESAPDRVLSLAAELFICGDLTNCAKCLDLIDRAGLSADAEPRLAARIAGSRAALFAHTGKEDDAVRQAEEARRIVEHAQLADDWVSLSIANLARVYAYLGDYEAVEREAAVAARDLRGPVARVAVPGAQAAAWLELGNLDKAAKAADAADQEAGILGFDRHFFALDHLRALAGLAMERRDLDAAERFTERALSISERRRPAFEFLALLDRATIWASRGLVREALPTIEAARTVLEGSGSVLLERADELEAMLRLSLGDLASAARLADRLPACPRQQLLARIALSADDHESAGEYLRTLPSDLTPRRAIQTRALQAAAAISRADPRVTGIVADLVDAARRDGYCNTVVTAAPQLTGYLIEHSVQTHLDPFMEQLIAAALDARTADTDYAPRQQPLAEPLTDAELRVLRLLPTNTYLQMADRLFISRNTVKTHLRSIYHKLVVATRKEAIERAIDLHLL